MRLGGKSGSKAKTVQRAPNRKPDIRPEKDLENGGRWTIRDISQASQAGCDSML